MPARPRPPRRLSAVLAAIAVLALPAGCDRAGPPGTGGRGGDGPVTVVLATAAERPFSQAVEGIATLRAREAVTVTAPASGRVREVSFREGQPVQAGAVLVRLEDDEERAEFNAARANAELQAARFARVQELQGKGLVSQDERDAAAQALREADAREELARVRLGLRAVRAPFAGVLGFRQVSPGALVQPGAPIVTLDAIDSLRADFAVPETLVGVIDAGAGITARSAAWPGRVFRGEVTLVGTRVEADTRAVTVQARLDNRDRALKPGMLLTVSLPARARPALFVPEGALVPENARQYVWRVDAGGKASRVEVSPGARHDGQVEIVAGLAAGDRVVVEGQGNLREGVAVAEREATPAAGTPAVGAVPEP